MIRDLPLRFIVPGIIFLVGTGTVSITLFMGWRTGREELLAEMTHHVRVIGLALSGQIEAALLKHDSGDIDTAVESLQNDKDLISADVVGPDQRIISSTRISAIGRRLGREGFEDILKLVQQSRDNGRAILRPEAGKRLLAVFPLRLRESSRALLPDARGYLIMEYDMARGEAVNDSLILADTGYRVTAITILCLIIWLFVRYRLLDRVQRMAQMARRVGEGDFSGRLQDNSRDELGELARDLESMAQRLERNTRELTYQALHDNLTGRLNRWGFERQLQAILKRLPHEQRQHALVFLDMDQFRVINETWGHSAGDEYLRELSAIIDEKLFARDQLARLGGDEFAVLLDDCSETQALGKAEELRRAVEEFRFQWQENTLRATASLGLVPVRRGMDDPEQLFTRADAACFAAKHGGRNRVQLWHEEDEELQRVHGEMRWVNRIRTALEEDRFLLYAQPIVPVRENADDRLRYEILLRMRDEHGRQVPPDEFLPAVEHYHLAAGVDRWVIQHAIGELAARPSHLENLEMCTINLSGLSLNDTTLADFVSKMLDRGNPLLPRHLCFEITETAAITHLGQASAFIRKIQALGCRFALDDFGSGVSSFGYLKNLPVDYIKIDGMFVRDLLEDPVDRALVNAVNEIVHKMGKQTIAEFVESRAIRSALADIGVDYAQGYATGRPLPLEDLLGPPQHKSY